jgi:hypothetical protein
MQKICLIALAALLSGAVVAAFPEHEGHSHDAPLLDRQYKVGKDGEINIRENLSIGNSILTRGRYKVVHKPDRDEHWFIFSPVAKNGSAGEGGKDFQVKARQLLPAREKVSGFVIHAFHDAHAGARNQPRYTIVKITVNGENWEHLF